MTPTPMNTDAALADGEAATARVSFEIERLGLCDEVAVSHVRESRCVRLYFLRAPGLDPSEGLDFAATPEGTSRAVAYVHEYRWTVP